MRSLFPKRWVRRIYDLFAPEDSLKAARQAGAATQRKNQFLEYLEILSARRGYAYAGNRSLSEKFGVSTRTIQRWLRSMDDAGLITIEQSGRVRRIFIGAKRKKDGVEKRSVSSMSPPARPSVTMLRPFDASERRVVTPCKSSSTAPEGTVHKKLAPAIPDEASVDEICKILWGHG